MYVEHRPTFEPKRDASRKLCLAALSRRHCPTCGPESLFAGPRCVTCRADTVEKPNKRARRSRFNHGDTL